MAIEILGFVVKEISIGDIAAVAALIASAVTFWFGYIRTRRSEQIRIARDLMDRIQTKIDQYEKEETKRVRIVERELLLFQLTDDIDYFSYLIKRHEIVEKNVLDYYAPKLYQYLQSIKRNFTSLNQEKPGTNEDSRLDCLISFWKDKLRERGILDKYDTRISSIAADK
jgi:hypothetical protein